MMMESKLKGGWTAGAIDKLSTILRVESYRCCLRHNSLLKVERPKDSKSFILCAVRAELLIPQISELTKMGYFWGIRRVFGSGDIYYAEVSFPENSLTLSSMLSSETEISETHLAAFMSKVLKCKQSLLCMGLNNVVMKPELIFLEESGKLHITLLDVEQQAEIFTDVVEIFRSLLEKRSLPAKKEEAGLSQTLLDLIDQMDKLNKLKHKSSLEALHPKHKQIWEKVANHQFVKQKFQKQALAEVFKNTQQKILLFGSEFQAGVNWEPMQTQTIVVDRICWRCLDTKYSVPMHTGETSDSSGGSSGSHMISTSIDPSREQTQQALLQSHLMQQSCKSVLETLIQNSKQDGNGGFLTGALETLLDTLLTSEESNPGSVLQAIQELTNLN
jgi:hypothetical protein